MYGGGYKYLELTDDLTKPGGSYMSRKEYDDYAKRVSDFMYGVTP